MKDRALVSIIVPVYNAESYLPKCLDSLINQTIKNIEIILINDGSTDNSAYICEKYKNQDRRIIYKKILNNGVSNARNVGIELSQAEWITFVDSDDWVSLDYCEKLISYKNDEIGLVIGRTLSVENGIVLSDAFKGKQCTYFRTDDEKLTLYRSIINDNPKVRKYPHLATCSAKLFKKEIIDKYKIRYKTNLKYYEDAIFNMQVIDKSRAVAVLADKLYYYRFNNTSATQNFYFNTVQYYENAAEELLNLIRELNLQIKDDYYQFNIKNMDTFLTNYFKKKKGIREEYRFVKKVCNRKIFKDTILHVHWTTLTSKRRIAIVLCGKFKAYFLIQFLYKIKVK